MMVSDNKKVSMALAFREFNLTQYSQLRQLEFQYTKVQDENQDLKHKLNTLEHLFKSTIKQLNNKHTLLKNNQQQQHQHQQHMQQQQQQYIQQLQNKIQSISQQLHKFQNMGIEVGQQQHQQDQQKPQTDMLPQLGRIENCLLFLLTKNSELSLAYTKEIEGYKAQTRMQRQVEQQYKEELDYLSCQLSRIEKLNESLSNELALTRRQNKDLKLKVYQLGQSSLSSSRVEDETIEDNNFTVDLLHFQKELLERTFSKVIAAIQTEALASVLTDIYEGCRAVGEAVRQKLQIEYDLQDLEQEYRREKNSKVNEKLLIQLRKQIEEFRLELQKQKDLQGQEELALEELLLLLRGTESQQKQVRNYAVEVQKQLHQIKNTQELKTAKDTKRQQESSTVRDNSRIRFRASQNGEEVLLEAVRQDRENIEKLFKQTRRTYLKAMD